MALPTDVSTFFNRKEAIPPFLSSAGNVYVVAYAGGNPGVYKATDPTASFAEQDGANRPAALVSSANTMIHAVQYGDMIHLASIDANRAVLEYSSFDMASDVWVTTDELINTYNGMTVPDTSIYWCSIAYRPGAANEIVVASCLAPVSDMGGAYESVGFWHKDKDATSWTGPVAIASGSNANGSYIQPVMATNPVTSKVHVFYSNASTQAQPVVSVNGMRGRTISTANALSTQRTSTSSSGTSMLGLGNPIAYEYEGNHYAALPVSSTIGVFIVADEDGSGDMLSISGVSYSAGFSIGVNGERKLHSLVYDPVAAALHVIYVNETDADIYKDVSYDNGATWGTDTSVLANTSCFQVDAAIFQRDGVYTLAYAYLYSTGTRYNELALTVPSMAALSDGVFDVPIANIGPFEV